jgi:hypothetical protein
MADRITKSMVKRAFTIFTNEYKIPTSAKWLKNKREWSRRWLKLDYNPYYGGWRMDWVNKGTSESFYSTASRRNSREMYSYLWGLIEGKRHRRR